MRQQKRILALTVSGLLLLGSLPVYAAPTGPDGIPASGSKYDEETTKRLEDNVLEYDEISRRVRDYNPTITLMWDSHNDGRSDYERILTEVESQYPSVKEMADGYVALGKQIGDEDLIRAGTQLDKGFRAIISGMRDTVTGWSTNKKATSTFAGYEKQITAGAQSAMIGYDTIRRNITTLETTVQLYEKQSQMYARMAELGLVAQTDVMNANTQLLGAQSSLASLKAQEESTRRTLCMLLGYDPDEAVEIRPIPEFDMARVTAMNLEEDTTKATGNNTTLISQRTSAQGKTNDQVAARTKTIQEGDQKLTIEMQRLYQAVLDSKAAYEAAQTGYAAAEKSFGAASSQYENGMISSVQYIGSQISYYAKKAELESANLGLWQAMENYDWAIAGLAEIE